MTEFFIGDIVKTDGEFHCLEKDKLYTVSTVVTISGSDGPALGFTYDDDPMKATWIASRFVLVTRPGGLLVEDKALEHVKKRLRELHTSTEAFDRTRRSELMAMLREVWGLQIAIGPVFEEIGA